MSRISTIGTPRSNADEKQINPKVLMSMIVIADVNWIATHAAAIGAGELPIPFVWSAAASLALRSL